MSWTPERVAALRDLWPQDLTTAEIGRRIGVTKNAVIGKAARLGLDPRESPIKSAKPRVRIVRTEPRLEAYGAADVDAWVAAYEGGESLRSISDRTGAGRSTIRRWLIRRGVELRDTTPPPMPHAVTRRRIEWPERVAPKPPSSWPAPGPTTAQTCQWPTPLPGGGFSFCGCQSHRAAYCLDHYRRAHTPLPARAVA